MCGCLLCGPHWGPGQQPRQVPWLGIELATLWFTASAQSTEPHQPGLIIRLLSRTIQEVLGASGPVPVRTGDADLTVTPQGSQVEWKRWCGRQVHIWVMFSWLPKPRFWNELPVPTDVHPDDSFPLFSSCGLTPPPPCTVRVHIPTPLIRYS